MELREGREGGRMGEKRDGGMEEERDGGRWEGGETEVEMTASTQNLNFAIRQKTTSFNFLST